jgi:hypothetical protein
VPNLASFSLPDTLRAGEMLIEALRALLLHIDKCEALPNQRIFHRVTDYVTGQFERCGYAACKLDMDILGWSARNLFELSFLADYVCASDQNMKRFVALERCSGTSVLVWRLRNQLRRCPWARPTSTPMPHPSPSEPY